MRSGTLVRTFGRQVGGEERLLRLVSPQRRPLTSRVRVRHVDPDVVAEPGSTVILARPDELR